LEANIAEGKNIKAIGSNVKKTRRILNDL
jgi:hypothetical protein